MTLGSPRSTVVCIGVATLDHIAAVEELPGPDGRVLASDLVEAGGGPAATAAVTLARLGVGVSFIGMVGDDGDGSRIVGGLGDEGVDTTHVRRVPGARSASSVIVVHRPSAQRSIVTFPGSCGPPVLTPEALDLCAEAAWIHLDQTGYPALAALREAGVRTPVSLDGGNPIPGLDLAAINLYAPNESALRRVFGGGTLPELLARALYSGPEIVAVTQGRDGSLAAVADSTQPDGVRRYLAESLAVDPLVSTLGAGDVFHGALLAGLLDRELPEALRFANAAAALSCRALDGRSAIPTRAELAPFLAAPT